MKKQLLIFTFILSSLCFLNSCSSSLPEIKEVPDEESSIYENNLRINTKQIYSWINRMPGSKARFHVSGELELLENSEFDITTTKISKIKILQGGTEVYQFTPKYEIKEESGSRTITFSTIRGLLVSLMLDANETIDIKILLSDSTNNVEFIIPKVDIEEVH